MFYLYILVHALCSFYIIYLDDYSVLEIYINVAANSNSVRNYCSYKERNRIELKMLYLL